MFKSDSSIPISVIHVLISPFLSKCISYTLPLKLAYFTVDPTFPIWNHLIKERKSFLPRELTIKWGLIGFIRSSSAPSSHSGVRVLPGRHLECHQRVAVMRLAGTLWLFLIRTNYPVQAHDLHTPNERPGSLGPFPSGGPRVSRSHWRGPAARYFYLCPVSIAGPQWRNYANDRANKDANIISQRNKLRFLGLHWT